MELSQLVTLIHVAELGSLSKAADRLNIVQPALSRQIRLLEAELGAALFERHGRGMALTAAGQEVRDHAVRVLAELDAMRQTIEDGRSSFRGRIRIGTTPTVADIVTVPLMRRIRDQHPHLAIRFSSAFSGHLLDWLQRGELDIAMSYDPPPSRAVRVAPVMMERLHLIGTQPLAGPVAFAALVSQPLILPAPRHGLRTLIDDCARRAGVALAPVVEVESYAAMIDLTKAGFGRTILPLAPIHARVRQGELVATALVDPPPERRLVLCYPADRPVSPAARHVGRSLVELAAKLNRAGVWDGRMIDADAKG